MVAEVRTVVILGVWLSAEKLPVPYLSAGHKVCALCQDSESCLL